jgi:hypothetical protein
MPRDDAHPFWLAIESLGDAVAKTLTEVGIDPEELLKTWSTENGSHLTVSSDTPSNAAYFWVYLPMNPAAQSKMLGTILVHLTRARRALPEANWAAALDDLPLVWADEAFHLPV